MHSEKSFKSMLKAVEDFIEVAGVQFHEANGEWGWSWEMGDVIAELRSRGFKRTGAHWWYKEPYEIEISGTHCAVIHCGFGRNDVIDETRDLTRAWLAECLDEIT